MARKTPVANPQTRQWTPENDCCNRSSDEQNHSRGCMNNPVNAKPEPKAAPDKQPHKLVEKKPRAGWCKFKSKGRSYVEGAMLEDADQEISLSPAGSYRQRNNKNLELVEGEIPVLPEDAPARPNKNDSVTVRREFTEYETSFIDALEDGDPRVGAAPGGLKLIKQ